LDLGKLSALDGLVEDLAQARVTISDARRRIDEILVERSPYSALLTTISYALTCACATRFFGGGMREIAASLVIGLVIGIGELTAPISRRLTALFAPLAATFAAFLSTVVAMYWPPASAYVITLGSLIVLVPGLTITVAVRELATRHLASGTARLSGALVLFATMGFGVALGTRIGAFSFGPPPFVEPVMLPGWTELIALVLAPIALAIEMHADRRLILWIIAGCVLAFGAARFGGNLLGTELGVFAGATLLGIGSNLFARFIRRPSAVVLIPGMIMLVPGGMGFRGMSAMLRGDVVSGVETLFLVAMVAVALVTGLLVADMFVPPRKAL
jgi:uncharacterized membrane protein YjjP (DUF1212 family)